MYKRMIVLLVALLMVFPMITSAKQVKKLNVAPLMKVPKKGGISSAETFQKLAETYKDRIKAGFEKVGLSSCYEPFMERVKQGNFEEKVIPMGQKIPWMLFYSKKEVKVSKEVEWAGKKTFKAYAFKVNCECKEYEFIVPQVCGNVSLLDEKSGMATCNVVVTPTEAFTDEPVKIDLSGSKCASSYEIAITSNGKDVDFKKLTGGTSNYDVSLKEPGEYTVTVKAFNADGVASQNECTAKFTLKKRPVPPVCDLKVNPTKGYVGQKISLDASGSKDPDGTIVKADFSVTGPAPDKKTIDKSPFVWPKVFKKSGVYEASVEVTDNDGLTSKNSCVVRDIRIQKRLYFLAEAGPMVAKGTYTGYVFARLGFSYLVVPEKWSLVGSAGYAVKLTGERFKNHLLANVVMNYHMSDFFLGAGVGVDSRVRDDWKAAFNIVGNIGYDVIKGFNHKGSIFGEIRIPFVEDVPFKEAHEFLLGFRYQF